jgi:hypothetical protein
VPCHREPPDEGLVRRLLEQVPRVLIVDDGMPAGAGPGLARVASSERVEAIHLGRRSGKGHAIAAGLAALRASATPAQGVLLLDADGQHPPESVPAFIEASARADLVIGNRFADGASGMPPVRRASNRVSSAIVSLTSSAPVPDSQCGMRLLHRRALSEVLFPGGGMESETRHLKRCLRAGVAVAWVPIPAIYRGQHSSFRTVRDSVSVMRAALGR